MKKFIKRLIWLLVLGSLATAGLSAVAIAYITHDLPKLDSMADYRPPLVTRVYDAQNHVIAEFAIEKRTLVNVAQLPAHVRHAFIAAEDADFYNHKGIDYGGVFRAVLNEIKYKIVGGQRIGGSTITQQTAKLMLLSSKKTYTRKLKEMILAQRIEEALNKDEILNIYLNQIYFGNGAYGIEEAARTYYGVSAKNLTLGQAAALAAAPKSPNILNPIADPERVRARRDYVLEQMVVHGFTSQNYAQAARKEKIEAKQNPNPYLDIAPYFAEEIRRQLVEKFGQEAVLYHGLSVYTSLNSSMQAAANSGFATGLRAVDKRQGYRGAALRLDSQSLEKLKEALNARRATMFTAANSKTRVWNLKLFLLDYKEKGLEPAITKIGYERLEQGTIVAGLVKSISSQDKVAVVDLGSVDGILPFAKMSWARPFNIDRYTAPPANISEVVKAGDVVFVRIENAGGAQPALALEQEPLASGALVALDVKTGGVLSMVGGYDFRTSQFNRATQAKRQPGSSFKPFVYSTAIDKEKVTAATIITDAPKVFFEAKQDGNWKPKNSTGKFLGDITVRTCLIRSVNTCSITLLEMLGVDAVRDTATKVGLLTERTPFPRDLTIALGSADVIPIDMVNAYRVFPNAGRYAPYVLFHKVATPKGEILFESKTVTTQALRPETAFITTSILKGLMRGVGKSVTGLSGELAGKTGTTNQTRSAWWVGYSQDIVAGVYVGFDDNRSLGPAEYGFKAALPIWGYFMNGALREVPTRPFEEPAGLVWRLIDQKTGLLAGTDSGFETDDDSSTANGDENTDAAPVSRGVVLEAFLPGTEPRSQASSAPPPLEMMESGGIAP